MIELPEVSDQDVQWACNVLGLPETAFSGPDGADPRLAVLRANTTLDVEACPGSGKTTLLVAKLAILARHWNTEERGICVLSHTNAARREIEKKLGATSEGQRLLSYPHYVGTIHGFVNEYLALPWLRSKGITIEAVDDEICLAWRWRKLPFATRRALENRQGSVYRLRYQNSNFDLGDIPWGRGGALGKASATYQNIQGVCRESYEIGLFCHDEMFVWASDLLDQHPQVTRHLRHRFPLLLIDEVQDNSEAQSQLLQRVFMAGNHAVLRQRFGDQNQAIYNYQSQDGAATDRFPIEDIKRTLPNSYRFGNSVATLADPLGVSPQGLVGQGGVGRSGEPELVGRHAIFLLDDDSAERVIDEYVTYLRQEFGAAELSSGDFTAVGAVHRAHRKGNLPFSVKHFWPEYDPEISGAEPTPNTLLQYLAAGHRLADLSGETCDLVEKLAEGVLRLARLLTPETTIGKRRRNHRHVMELLEGNAETLETYLYLVRTLAVSRILPTQFRWEAVYRDLFEAVARWLSASDAPNAAVSEFLAWHEIGNVNAAKVKRNNVFMDATQEPAIKVRVGSIHSVKGETHTATLVLDTFYYKHHLKELKPWLLGQTKGGNGRSDRIKRRLTLHYVAMTRAARLLCLAMRADAFDEAEIDMLRGNGWRVARVTQAGIEWAE